MFDQMAAGTFRLKGRELYISKGLSTRRVRNIQEVSDLSKLTYSTVHRWIEKPEKVSGIDFTNLAAFLIDALGMTPNEVLEMKVGELLAFVPNSAATE